MFIIFLIVNCYIGNYFECHRLRSIICNKMFDDKLQEHSQNAFIHGNITYLIMKLAIQLPHPSVIILISPKLFTLIYMISVGHSKSDKKAASKKHSNKDTPKFDSPTDPISSLPTFICPILTINLLSKKYILKQLNNQKAENTRRMIINKNKITTEFRLSCTQKQFMCRFYTNPAAIIKLRSNNQQKNFKNSVGLHCYIRINLDDRLEDVFKVYRKHKTAMLSKMGKINDIQKNYLGFKNYSSPPLDDSEFCLKNLVNKIQSMIKFDYELGSAQIHSSRRTPQQRGLLDSIKNQNSNVLMDLLKQQFSNQGEETRKSLIGTFVTGDQIFGEEGKKISQINTHINLNEDYCDSEQNCHDKISNHNGAFDLDGQEKRVKERLSKKQKGKPASRKEQYRLENELYKLQSTQPLSAKPNIMDEYGILRQPPPEQMFRRKPKNPKSKKKTSLQSSNSSNKLSNSLGSKSKKKKEAANKKGGIKSRECPYQNPNQERTKKKELPKSKRHK